MNVLFYSLVDITYTLYELTCILLSVIVQKDLRVEITGCRIGILRYDSKFKGILLNIYQKETLFEVA